MAASKKELEAVGKAQFSLYEETELLQLNKLIDWAVHHTDRRNYTSLIETMNKRLSKRGWPLFSNSELSALLAPASDKTRRTGWSDRTKFRLVVGLALHDDLVIGLALLQLHLYGLADLTTDYESALKAVTGQAAAVETFDSTGGLQVWLDRASDEELAQLAHYLIDQLSGQQHETETETQRLLKAAIARPELESALYKETPFTVSRIQGLLSGESPTADERLTLLDWAVKHGLGKTQAVFAR